MAIFNAQMNTGDRALNVPIPDDILKKYQSQVSSGGMSTAQAIDAILAESSSYLNPKLYKTEAETPLGGYFGPGGGAVYQKTENGITAITDPNLRGALIYGLGLTNYYGVNEIENFNQFSGLLRNEGSQLFQYLSGNTAAAQPNYQPYQSPYQSNQSNQTTMQTPIGSYINTGGVYFQNTANGLSAVSDPTVLSKLKSGAIGSSAMSLSDFYGQKTAGSVTAPPPATAPSNVSQVNNIPSTVSMPSTTQPSTGNVANASAATDGYQKMIDLLFQQKKDYNDQLNQAISAQQQQSKSFIDTLANRPSATDLRAQAAAQIGVNPTDYFAKQQAAIAEVSTLRGEYDKTNAAMEAEKNLATDRLQTTGSISRQQSAIERKYAPTLSRLSADINSKVANIQGQQGLFQEAQNFINQAVSDATSEQKYQLDLFQTFYSMNQDTINRLSTNYQNAFNTALQLAQNEYNRSLQNANAVGDLMIKNPNAGINITDSLSTAFSKAGANPGTPNTQIIGSSETGYTQIRTDNNGNIISRTPVMGGSGSSGAGITIWDDSLITELQKGASPSQAAALVAANSPDSLSASEKTSLVNRAVTLSSNLPKISTPPAGATPTQQMIYDPKLGTTRPVKPSDLASDTYKTSFLRNDFTDAIYNFLFK